MASHAFWVDNVPAFFVDLMNRVFRDVLSKFVLVFIDDILVFSKTIELHYKHLNIFKQIVIQNDLVISKPKMSLFQINI